MNRSHDGRLQRVGGLPSPIESILSLPQTFARRGIEEMQAIRGDSERDRLADLDFRRRRHRQLLAVDGSVNETLSAKLLDIADGQRQRLFA